MFNVFWFCCVLYSTCCVLGVVCCVLYHDSTCCVLGVVCHVLYSACCVRRMSCLLCLPSRLRCVDRMLKRNGTI